MRLGVVAGLGLLVLAVTSQIIWLAIPGFLVMLGGATYAFSRPKAASAGPVGVVADDGSTRPRRRGSRQAARQRPRLHGAARGALGAPPRRVALTAPARPTPHPSLNHR